jgi:hypothetical protein
MWKASVDPGKYYINHPINANGTAFLKEGQYRNTYAIAKHQGVIDAVCQRLNVVTVRRYKPNNPTPRLDTGMFGINIHCNTDEAYNIGSASAGCQIFWDLEDFYMFMKICYKHKSEHGNVFTYTLFDKTYFGG